MTTALDLPGDATVASMLGAGLRERFGALLQVPAIDSPEHEQIANDVAHQVATVQKTIKAERAKATNLRRLANEYDRPWKPLDEWCERVKNHAKDLILAFRRRNEIAQRAQLEAAVESGAQPAEITAAVAVVTQAPTGFVEVEQWDIEITDRSAIPAEYFVLDEARLRREARALKTKFAVPGVRAVQTTGGRIT